MLKAILIGLAVVIVAFLGFVASRPNTFRVQRSLRIQAAPDKVYALIADFHTWSVWSPYENRDPAMQRTYSGAASGKGAAYAWSGNDKVGKGSMEIVDTVPVSRITIRLDFERPMVAHNTAEFTLQGVDGGTEVTWAMFGPNPFLGKLMHTFFNMDKMVGNDFAKGLSNLRTAAEK
jgi:hypothetical protein